jgi:hypothetical protein
VSNFYGTEIEVWGGFGPVAILKKKISADYEQLLSSVLRAARLMYNDFETNLGMRSNVIMINM